MAQRLWHAGSAALQRVGSSRTGGEETHAFCVGRQILNHGTTRGVLGLAFPKQRCGRHVYSFPSGSSPCHCVPKPAPPLPPPLRCPLSRDAPGMQTLRTRARLCTGDGAGGVHPRLTVDTPLPRGLPGLGPCRPHPQFASLEPRDFLPRDPGHDVLTGDVQRLGGASRPPASPRAHQEPAHRGPRGELCFCRFIYFILMGFNIAVRMFNRRYLETQVAMSPSLSFSFFS